MGFDSKEGLIRTGLLTYSIPVPWVTAHKVTNTENHRHPGDIKFLKNTLSLKFKRKYKKDLVSYNCSRDGELKVLSFKNVYFIWK